MTTLYTNHDLYRSILPFGSADVDIFTEKCNKWEIAPWEAVQYIELNSPDAKTDDMNNLFYALHCVRIQKLLEMAQEVLKEYSLKTKTITKLVKLIHYLETEGLNRIACNYYVSDFDCEIINAFDHCTFADSFYNVVISLNDKIQSN